MHEPTRNHPAVPFSTAEQCGMRTDDYCPVCDAWPRRTMPSATHPKTHRVCMTCGQEWEDHGDHTPPDEQEGFYWNQPKGT